jgi:hypothetical protein
MHYNGKVVSSSSKGQSFLALVFLIGGIVALAGLAIAFFASSFVDSGFGYQASAAAEAAATSGAEDALLQLDRNSSFAAGSYSFIVASTTATVSVTQNFPSANLINISSTATVSGRVRTIGVIVAKNSSSSQLSIISWQETQ